MADPRARYCDVRDRTEVLAAPLGPEDQTVQSMPDVSPTKWHRAHVTWFFEEFVLGPHTTGYEPFHEKYGYLFNSYYEAVGPRHPRAARGAVSRPTVDDITAYRGAVDISMVGLLAEMDDGLADLVELGLHHEQQHQELLLMDAKHVLSQSVLDPAYRAFRDATVGVSRPVSWIGHPGGLVEIGTTGDGTFSYDNERPLHAVHVQPFELADRTVTCGEWLAFLADGGYERPELWLSDGWAQVCDGTLAAPLYWRAEDDGTWTVFTLGGRQAVDPAEPVCHVSYYEADAYARWADARLPSEAEWEVVARDHVDTSAPEFDLDHLHPQATPTDRTDFFGGVWEWTSSPYTPYPGFAPGPGAIGEYNGKFMVSQQVLRGGCCVTPEGHVRPTYRNFFPPPARWAFTGLRLARDAGSPRQGPA